MELTKRYDNKTYILVKLSESLSNAIHDHQNPNNKRLKLHSSHHNQPPQKSHIAHQSEPTIFFRGTRGAIRFPDGKSYDFSLEQSENTVECIKQTRDKWESIGKMACCLHVKGKDDAYQRTKIKMEVAEKERRRYRTKLLAANGEQEQLVELNNHGDSNNISINNNHSPAERSFDEMKADFKAEHKEYEELRLYLQKIEMKFRALEKKLKHTEEGSREWESVKNEIFKEYDKVNSDDNFHDARQRYKQLHIELNNKKEKLLQLRKQNRQC